MTRFDETWHRLREWTAGQAAAEALAAQIVAGHGEGFAAIDPSHPHGGPDGGKDGHMHRDGVKFIMAVYFPRGQKSYSQIKKKFRVDLVGVSQNAAAGIAFVTNQELALGERAGLRKLAKPYVIEIYHLERVASILDRPEMSGVREQFLDIPQVPGAEIIARMDRLESVHTGGDTFCYVMLYDFNLAKEIARNFATIKVGEFNLYDLHMRIVTFPDPADTMNRPMEVMNRELGEHHSPAWAALVEWPLRDRFFARIFFNARNGQWHQDLQLLRSDEDGCWLAATRVIGRNGRDVLFTHIDHDFVERFGEPDWWF